MQASEPPNGATGFNKKDTMFKSRYFQLVELTCNAASGNQDTYFQQQPQLQSITGDKVIFIKAIEAYTANDIIKSPFTPGQTVAAAVDLSNALLTLRVKGTDLIKQIPLTRLNPTLSNGGQSSAAFNLWLLQNQYEIDWTQSRVTNILALGSGGTTAGPLSYIFGIHYSYDADALDMKPVNLNVFTQPVKTV